MPTPISPAIIGEHEFFLLYGKPKVGKTHAALTAPRPIYMIMSGNTNEAKTFYSKSFQEKYGKDFKKDDLLLDAGSSSQEIKDLAEKAIEDAESGKGPDFASIVVDNATPLTALQMDVAFQITSDRAKDKDKTALEKFEKYGAVIPNQDDWGIAQGIMRRFISDLMGGANRHVVFIAHEYETFTAQGQGKAPVLERVEPWFIGKDRTQVANTFDNVWRLTWEGQNTSAARTEPGTYQTYAVVAGSRIKGVVPRDYANPNLTDAIKKFREHAEKMMEAQVAEKVEAQVTEEMEAQVTS